MILINRATGVQWSPNGHYLVSYSCYTETSKQDVGSYPYPYHHHNKSLMSSMRMVITFGITVVKRYAQSVSLASLPSSSALGL